MTTVLPGGYPAARDIVTTTDVPPEVKEFFQGYVGIVAKKRCVLHYLAEQTNIDAKSGSTLIIPTFKRMETDKLPILTEGVTPKGSKIAREDIKITPQQLGNYVETTDVVTLTVQDHTLQHFAYILGLHLAESCDRMIAEALDATLNVGYATGGGADMGQTDKPGFIQGSDIITAANILKQNSAYMVSPNIFGSTIFGSTPVRESFYCFNNVKVEPDLYRIPGFAALAHYGSPQTAHALPGEIGEYMNVRFVSSQLLKEDTTSTGAAADKPFLGNFFLGRYAYYTTRLGRGSTQFIFSHHSGFDPLRQRVQIGYKSWFGAAVNTANKWVYKLVSRTSTTL